MRLRTALLSLGCSMAILVAGCSSGTIAGSPEIQGGLPSATATGTGGGSGGTGGSGSAGTAGTGTGGSAGTGGSSTGDGGSGSGGTGGPSGGPTGVPNITELPTDLTDLSNIPGLSGECMSIVNAYIAIGTLFLGPTLGGASLTQDQVDAAFKGLDSAPAEIQPAIKTLHDAANQAVGKSATDALQILGSDAVSKALDQLGDYSDQHCKS